jgi:phosphoribosylamine--glycine ligase
MSLTSVRRVLVVGSWAKEEITVQHLKRTSSADVLVYMDTENPGITRRADACRVGRLNDIDAIVSWARDQGVDLVLVTTAAPLAAGLVDRLDEAGIAGFGPPRAVARLESDKAFARDLVRRCRPDAVPRYRVFEEPAPAVAFAEELGWQVAVKPIGLTDGLGVRVWGDQLRDAAEVTAYIEEVVRRGIGGRGQVIVEERLEGEEFTLQALVHEDRLVPTPTVQDHKKLLPGEAGPNTASMGSYATSGWLLPFLSAADYDVALDIMRASLFAAREETGVSCRGFLYGQFMVTAGGVRLVEYNFRPGDPEWMNTMATLKTPLLDAVVELMGGGEPRLGFEPRATVCKYIVPEGYPEERNLRLKVLFDADAVRREGVALYYSGGLAEGGGLDVGSERGIAFLAAADTVEGAHDRVEAAIAAVSGSFFHREDIGTADLVASKAEHLRQLRAAGVRFRPAREDEFLDIQGFVSGCPPLEAYPQHVYRILLRHFGSCSFVAERRGRVLGFVLGLVSHRHPGTYFLWQIGVAPDQQGTGLGTRLLRYVELELVGLGLRRVDVTVDPLNDPSRRLFEVEGYRNVSGREGATVVVNGQLAAADFYRPGRHFLVYDKPLDGSPPSRARVPTVDDQR